MWTKLECFVYFFDSLIKIFYIVEIIEQNDLTHFNNNFSISRSLLLIRQNYAENEKSLVGVEQK